MSRISKQTIRDIKISMFWITMFVLILSALSNWLLLKENKELIDKLDICEHNFEEIGKQIKSGRVVLEIE